MNETLTDPVLIIFILGLAISSYLMLINNEKKTSMLLISSLSFAMVGITSSAYT